MNSHPAFFAKLVRTLLGGMALHGALTAHAQDDGPRGYLLAPTDITALGAQAIFMESNQTFAAGVVLKGLDITCNVGVVQIAKPLNVAGVMVAPLLIVPFGEVEANFAATRFRFDRDARALITDDRTVTGRSSGLGDIELGVVIGLYGAPPLTSAEYLKYDPGLSIGLREAQLLVHARSYHLRRSLSRYFTGLPTFSALP